MARFISSPQRSDGSATILTSLNDACSCWRRASRRTRGIATSTVRRSICLSQGELRSFGNAIIVSRASVASLTTSGAVADTATGARTSCLLCSDVDGASWRRHCIARRRASVMGLTWRGASLNRKKRWRLDIALKVGRTRLSPRLQVQPASITDGFSFR